MKHLCIKIPDRSIQSRFFLTLLAFFIFSLWGNSQTIISEDSVYGQWTKEGSPYLITKDVTVPSGKLLVINPGTVIRFAGSYALRVDGKLIAKGNKKEMIAFSMADSSEIIENKGALNTTAFGWKGIRFSKKTVSSDTSQISFCIIQDVQALSGTGEECAGGAISIFGKNVLFIKNCHLHHNKAHLGAAIFCEGNDPVIDGNLIEYNESLSNGGAIYISNSHTIFKNNLIRFNKSPEFGGGIYADRVYGDFINNTFVQNHARFGGAVSLNKSNPGFINNTIADNRAEINGGAIHCLQSSPYVRNSIVWGNNARDRGHQLYLYAYGYPDIEYSAVEGGERAVEKFSDSLNDVSNYDHNIEFDPLLLQNDSVYYGLDEFSPCIDAGHNTDKVISEEFDMNGRPRILNKIIDMGAQEFWMIIKEDSIEREYKDNPNNKDNKLSVLIYPNPNQGRFKIEISDVEANIATIGLIDSKGQVIYLTNFNTGQIRYVQEMEFDLNSGVYFLELKDTKGKVVKRGKIIIE